MRVWIRVTVGETLYDVRVGEAEVAVDTKCPHPEQLPWHILCAGLVQGAMQDYEDKLEGEDVEAAG